VFLAIRVRKDSVFYANFTSLLKKIPWCSIEKVPWYFRAVLFILVQFTMVCRGKLYHGKTTPKYHPRYSWEKRNTSFDKYWYITIDVT